MPQSSDATPLVSLVIPVYNAMPYLVEGLDAIERQGLDAAQLEVILVNDGSNDGSERVLADYAARHPNYRLINQPNSGGPADPCNKGIAAVTGKYFFVVGADDYLTDGALRDLVDFAEREESEIVLAKMAGLNGRHAPGSMFTRTVADADIVDDKLYNSLTAIKLFRTDVVRRCGAYNPTHLRVGSDQPFTLACYLVAKKISVCSDRPYVMIRKREDGQNVTVSYRRSSWDYARLSTANLEVTEKWSEPGRLRDGIMRRTVRGALSKSLAERFLDLDEEKQEAVVQEIRNSPLQRMFNDAVAAHLTALPRLKVRLALEGRTDVLRRVVRWEKDGGVESLVHDEQGFRLELPEGVTSEVGDDLLRDVRVVGVVRLEKIAVDGTTVRLAGSAQVSRGATAPDEARLRVQNRATGEWNDLPVAAPEVVGRGGAEALEFRADVDMALYARGIWDFYVVHRYGTQELINRLGRHRGPEVADSRRRLLDAATSEDLGIVYFTQGFGNLSVDRGYTVLARTGPDVRLLTSLQIGASTLLVILASAEGMTISATAHGERSAKDDGEQVTVVEAGEGLLALTLARQSETSGRWLKVDDGYGQVVLPIPEAVKVPRAATARTLLSDAAAGSERVARGAVRRLRALRRSA